MIPALDGNLLPAPTEIQLVLQIWSDRILAGFASKTVEAGRIDLINNGTKLKRTR